VSVVREKALWLAELAEAASGTGTAGGGAHPLPGLRGPRRCRSAAQKRVVPGWVALNIIGGRPELGVPSLASENLVVAKGVLVKAGVGFVLLAFPAHRRASWRLLGSHLQPALGRASIMVFIISRYRHIDVHIPDRLL